ncbi:MAG: hypothetical protein JO352_13135, partial [Chloroflexi bacterium]|nr:hypothetical protein [Chloroflexota bacterium]
MVEGGKQDAFAVADLLREDATAGTGLTWATAALVAEAFGLSRLLCGESLGEGVQLGVGQSGQLRAGEPLDDVSARGAQVAVQKGEQIGGGGEADRGHAGVVAMVIEDLAGLLDVVADAGGGDLQEFGKYVHGADLPLVQQREQQSCGIVEQRLVSNFPAGAPGPATPLLALLGAGGLGRSEASGELLQVCGAHASQPLIGQPAEYSLATLRGTARFTDGCWPGGVGAAAGVQAVVPRTVGSMRSSGRAWRRSLLTATPV